MVVAQRKMKYGSKVIAVSTVMRELAEELIDLTERLERQNLDVGAEILMNHHAGIVDRVQVRADLIHKLSNLL